jgi:ParB family chromosome partitioning protein
MIHKKVLGRGLGALIPQPRQEAPEVQATPGLAEIPISQIQPNPYQPRKTFNEASIEELARSVREHGIVQPLVVTRSGDKYKLIAGERRFRAAQKAGLTTVPALIKEMMQEGDALQIALIENIQREDLNAIETARAYERLGRDLGLSQEEIGRRTGKDRTSITNALRLLKLPPEVQLLLAEHRLSMGHARAILGLPTAEEQIQVAEKAAAQGLSVRQVEALVQDLTSDRTKVGSKKEKAPDPNVRAAVEEMERALGTRVRIVELSEQRGRIEIEYYSQTDLDRLFQQITSGVN